MATTVSGTDLGFSVLSPNSVYPVMLGLFSVLQLHALPYRHLNELLVPK